MNLDMLGVDLKNVLVAVLLLAATASARADNYYVNITEQSDTQLSVSISFPDYTFSGIVNSISQGPEEWALLPPGLNRIQGASLDNQVRLSEMAWLEPDSNPANPTYNVFTFGWVPSGTYTDTFMLFFSDMTAASIAGTPGIGGLFDKGCYAGGSPANCPLLGNGQTQSGIPLLRFTELGDVNAGLLDVTVNDTRDVVSGVPEPETYAMLFAGLGLLGFVAPRRKQLAG